MTIAPVRQMALDANDEDPLNERIKQLPDIIVAFLSIPASISACFGGRKFCRACYIVCDK